MSKIWKVGIVMDSSRMMLGLHGLHNAFRGLPDVDVVAHVDSNTENLAAKLDSSGARRHYSDYIEMLEKEKPDIVVLCSRHPCDHLPLISTAAERGCHIYCEKPLAANLPEADEIVKIAEQRQIKICMAHPARYDLAFLAMKKMIEVGEIGTPLTAYGRGKCDHRGGGEDMIVLGTHILDLQTFIFGAPECVMADVTLKNRPIVKADREEKTVEPIGPSAGDSVFASFRFPNGVRGIFESRRGLAGSESVQRTGIVNMGLCVVGTKGAISMRFKDFPARPVEKLRISRRPGPVEDSSSFEEVPVREERSIPGAEPLDYSRCGRMDVPEAGFFLEANRFAAWDLICSIMEDRQPVSNIYNARLAQEMIQGIYASGLSGSVVKFPLAERTHPLDD
ncbi:MAG: Gfo/Idh/MocA family oxidoreductase [Victivallales bacterium]|nr:Gfo/Idh/MocA family oxidoreductase [Victivallales bacterium]